MSDEESFVVLSKSPLNSLRSTADYSLFDNNSESFDITSNSNYESNRATSITDDGIDGYDKNARKVVQPSDIAAATKTNGNFEKSTTSMTSLNKDANASLAASFIMGEVGVDVLKTSVYSQFPSMTSLGACADDVHKLQNLMAEYVELKNTLAKVNGTMKQFYTKTQQWREETQIMQQNYKEQINNCQTEIATLRNENIELKRDLNTKLDEMKLAEECRQIDHNELIREISAKTAQLTNMSVHLEKLEEDQLASFEFIRKNANDNKDKTDYVLRLEHERIVKQLEQRMSQLLAENLDSKEIQKQYHDEIDCLKVNLTAAEELLNQSRADINLLKAKDVEKTESFAQYANDRDRMREEITLLRQQVEVYSKDFEMERIARQTLAGEKDKLLLDLRALQRKNHSLIEETQKVASELSAQAAAAPRPVTAPIVVTTSTAASSENTEETNNLRCPICFKVFIAYSVLSSHVNDCLDQLT